MSLHDFDPRMEAIRNARRERVRRLTQHAVPDTGIDLRRRGAVVLVTSPPPPEPPPRPPYWGLPLIAACPGWEPERLLQPEQKTPHCADIQRATMIVFNIRNVQQFISDSRSVRVVWPRQLAMYLCRRLTKNSLPEIGRRFRRDHTTTKHGIDKISKALADGDREVLPSLAIIVGVLLHQGFGVDGWDPTAIEGEQS